MAGAVVTDEKEDQGKKPAGPNAAVQPGEPTGAEAAGQAEKKPKVATDVDVNVNKAQVTVKVGAPKPEEPTTNAPQKPKTAPEVAVTVSPKEIGGNVEVMRHTAGGTQHGATAGGSYEFATGNTQATLGYKVATKGGSGGSIALTGGNSVTVEEPEEVAEDVWVVSYVISDSSGIAAGATGKLVEPNCQLPEVRRRRRCIRAHASSAPKLRPSSSTRTSVTCSKVKRRWANLFPPTSVHGADPQDPSRRVARSGRI